VVDRRRAAIAEDRVSLFLVLSVYILAQTEQLYKYFELLVWKEWLRYGIRS